MSVMISSYVAMAALAGCVAFLESTHGELDLHCLQITPYNDKTWVNIDI